MKKILSILTAFLGATTAAYAADMPAKAPAAPAAYNWSGCYIGVEGGGSWGRSQQVATAGAFAGSNINGQYDVTGGLAGGTFGCNLQYENVVFGIEDDAAWTNLRGSASDIPPFDTTATNQTRALWMNTVRGRVGYAFDRVLIYGTAGVALASTQVQVSSPTLGSVVDHQDRSGWVAGAGVEWAAWTMPWADLTFKVEYLHADFGSDLGSAQYFNPSITVGNILVVTRDTRLTTDTVRAGVNLKFNLGGATVAAK